MGKRLLEPYRPNLTSLRGKPDTDGAIRISLQTGHLRRPHRAELDRTHTHTWVAKDLGLESLSEGYPWSADGATGASGWIRSKRTYGILRNCPIYHHKGGFIMMWGIYDDLSSFNTIKYLLSSYVRNINIKYDLLF